MSGWEGLGSVGRACRVVPPADGVLLYFAVATLAQLVEHRFCKARVEGSSPLGGFARSRRPFVRARCQDELRGPVARAGSGQIAPVLPQNFKHGGACRPTKPLRVSCAPWRVARRHAARGRACGSVPLRSRSSRSDLGPHQRTAAASPRQPWASSRLVPNSEGSSSAR